MAASSYQATFPTAMAAGTLQVVISPVGGAPALADAVDIFLDNGIGKIGTVNPGTNGLPAALTYPINTTGTYHITFGNNGSANNNSANGTRVNPTGSSTITVASGAGSPVTVNQDYGGVGDLKAVLNGSPQADMQVTAVLLTDFQAGNAADKFVRSATVSDASGSFNYPNTKGSNPESVPLILLSGNTYIIQFTYKNVLKYTKTITT